MSPAAPGGAAALGAETPIRDRLVTTLFMAAVVHGMIILGVTFTADRAPRAAAPGLDVQLLTEDARDEPREREAAYLAQSSRVGAGTTTERVAARTPFGPPPEPDRAAGRDPAAPPGEPGDDGAAGGGAESVLASSARRPTVRYSGEFRPATGPDDLPLLTGAAAGAPPKVPPTADFGGEDAVDAVQLTGPAARAGSFVSPDTRRSLLAPYLDGWRRKVERLGTLNYPTVAREQATRSRWPVLEVEIAADGRLKSARVRRSSGDPRLDDAALQILKLASPFDPFPTDMARVFPELGFAYEWRFERGGPLSVAPSPGG
ncbi:MAG: TonB family protein [Steroidobacteraceae bacterium]|jgi:protein TonB|nr:TonB family protein [Steroidobacteraceae bacterium]